MNDTESEAQKAPWRTCRKCKQSDFTDFSTCRFCQAPYSGTSQSGYNFPGTQVIYAEPKDRTLSYIVDSLIFFGIFWVVPAFKDPHNLPWLFALNWLYQATLISQVGGTIGQFALGLRMTTTEGEAVTFFRATLRYLASFVTALTGGIGNLMAFGGKRQTLHDVISSCLLIEDDGQRHDQESGRGGAVLSLAIFLLLAAGLLVWQGKLNVHYAEMGSANEIGKSYYLASSVYGASDLNSLYEYSGVSKQVSGLFRNPFQLRSQNPSFNKMVSSGQIQNIYGTITKTLSIDPAGAQILDVLKDNPTGNPVYRVIILSGPQAGKQYWLQQKDLRFSAPFKISK